MASILSRPQCVKSPKTWFFVSLRKNELKISALLAIAKGIHLFSAASPTKTNNAIYVQPRLIVAASTPILIENIDSGAWFFESVM